MYTFKDTETGTWVYDCDFEEYVAFCSIEADPQTYRDFCDECWDDFGLIIEENP